jgi:hypothetical protein
MTSGFYMINFSIDLNSQNLVEKQGNTNIWFMIGLSNVGGIKFKVYCVVILKFYERSKVYVSAPLL